MKEEIELNGKKYMLESSIKNKKRESLANKKYVIARTESAGVFAGYLKKRTGKEVILQDARRLWYWDGAATLSQLAQEGTKKPNKCKFPCPIDEVLLLETIELILCTDSAKESIKGVKIWAE